ncbi:hypothetical protein BCR32DRAFT_284068 [Anaeromyces robustus]|uniref:Uncharacterized protein n=1 Tax=Anaeromyces robustus TaxID=1754192 RepID=A0A1Y1WSK9_9FUNG|nr:hypothetical protein BCR32DRAFT_284068 [Anaeromyces robustus]|eukprot:ORX76529.1 hypothetical protein BCR32DRAFT_284068 [Anaeromyces robustus]
MFLQHENGLETKKISGGYLGQDVDVKIDARVIKTAKIINNSCPNYYSCCVSIMIVIKELIIDLLIVSYLEIFV